MKQSHLTKSESRGIVILAILILLSLAGLRIYDRALEHRYATMPKVEVTYSAPPDTTASATASDTVRTKKKRRTRKSTSKHTTPTPPAYRTDRLSEQAD